LRQVVLGAVIAFAVTVAVFSFLSPRPLPTPSAGADAGLARPTAGQPVTAVNKLPVLRINRAKKMNAFEPLEDGGVE
jgi:hypothetical protein